MNKWYKSTPVKGILIAVEHVLVALVMISLLWISAYPGHEYATVFQDVSKGSYADTKGFTEVVHSATTDVLNSIKEKNNFETDGKYDETRLVDIMEYTEHQKISNENKSGIAYSLSDLKEWAASDRQYNAYENPTEIIVCSKIDGGYQYYYGDEFKDLIERGELVFVGNETKEYYLGYLENGHASSSNSGMANISNKDNELLYSDCWSFRAGFEEEYAPEGAENLLEIANTNEMWNGKLEEVFSRLSATLDMLGSSLENYENTGETWTEGNTNFAYMLIDKDRKQVYTNRAAYTKFDDLEKSIGQLKDLGAYIKVAPKLADFETNMDTAAVEWQQVLTTYDVVQGDYIYIAAIDTKYPIQDIFYTQNQSYEKYAPWMKSVMITGIFCAAAFFIILIWLTVVAGRTTQDGELKLSGFDKWKTEIAASVVMMVWSMVIGSASYGIRTGSTSDVYQYGVDLIGRTSSDSYLTVSNMIVVSIVAVFSCAMFLIGYLSLVRRIKAKTLWKNSLLRWFVKFFQELFKNRKCVTKLVVIYMAFVFVHWILMMNSSISGGWVLCVFGTEIAGFVFLVRAAIAKQKIKEGIQNIADGDIEYKISLRGLKGDDLEIAERINNIGEGFNCAVENSMRNERLKTDLITNVSHDIKTPLTSIINYVDILKREKFENPKIQGYLEILEKKAQRLKHLTEDVVEASKISSGNISLEFMRINLVEMINQTSGEFVEKFEQRNLKEVLNLPEEPALVRVDGRRMWRVLENIYNNAAKYALEGTRIYADLAVTEDLVEFSLKNISEQPLNIKADELTERFIRGDISRSTEGSGLGLSIAKNLTELQGGEFQLYLDGDLFKVTISFPKVIQE